jgi:hypothetical protein
VYHLTCISKSDLWKAAWQEVDIFNKNLIEDPTKQIPGFHLPRKIWCKLNRLEPAMANAIICCFTGTFVKTLLVNAVQKKETIQPRPAPATGQAAAA